MRNLLLISSFLICSIVQSQIVNIPDANFKNALVNTNCVDTSGDGIGDMDADTNNDGEIQVSEAEAILWLDVTYQFIDSLEGIQNFVKVLELKCGFNWLITLDTSLSPNLRVLDCRGNIRQLTTFDVTQNPNLEVLICYDSHLITLDVSENPNLISLWCYENEFINLNLKNGNNVILIDMVATLNPNLSCIQVDDVNFAQNAPNWVIDSSAEYSEFCLLGVQNNELRDFTLTPNPTQDILNVKTENQIETIKIFSLQGELLKETSNTNIDVSHLSSGLYFIQVSVLGKTSTKKFAKI